MSVNRRVPGVSWPGKDGWYWHGFDGTAHGPFVDEDAADFWSLFGDDNEDAIHSAIAATMMCGGMSRSAQMLAAKAKFEAIKAFNTRIYQRELLARDLAWEDLPEGDPAADPSAADPGRRSKEHYRQMAEAAIKAGGMVIAHPPVELGDAPERDRK